MKYKNHKQLFKVPLK